MHFELRLDEDIDSEGVEDFMIKPRSNAKTLSSVPLSCPVTRSMVA